MFSVRDLVLACLVVGAICSGLAGWYGYRDGRGDERADWLELEKQRTDTAAETARIAAAAETRATAQAEQRHVAVVARAQGVKRDATVVDRPAGEWAADERLRLQALHAAYFAHADAAGGLPGGLQPAAGTGRQAHGLGGADAGLGLRLPEAAK